MSLKRKRSTARRRAAAPKAYPWKPAAATKAQKEQRAMETHHRAERIPNSRCSVTSCRKACVVDSDYCASHRSLRVLHVPLHMDLNVYGA